MQRKVCRMHGARGGAPEGERNGNYRHGARSKETITLWKFIKLYANRCLLSGESGDDYEYSGSDAAVRGKITVMSVNSADCVTIRPRPIPVAVLVRRLDPGARAAYD
jgi:hypothetical protein